MIRWRKFTKVDKVPTLSHRLDAVGPKTSLLTQCVKGPSANTTRLRYWKVKQISLVLPSVSRHTYDSPAGDYPINYEYGCRVPQHLPSGEPQEIIELSDLHGTSTWYDSDK